MPNHGEYEYRGHSSHILQRHDMTEDEKQSFDKRLNTLCNMYEQLQLTDVGERVSLSNGYDGEYTGDVRGMDVIHSSRGMRELNEIVDYDDSYTWLTNKFDFELPEGMPNGYKKPDLSTIETDEGTYYEVYMPFVAKRGVEEASDRHVELLQDLFGDALESSKVMAGTEKDKFNDLKLVQLIEPKDLDVSKELSDLKDKKAHRIVIADTQPNLDNPDYVSVAFAYANDIEKQTDDVALMNHVSGNYVLLGQKTLDTFMDASNKEGDYPVFNAELLQDDTDRPTASGTAIPALNTVYKPNIPFSMSEHVANTSKHVTFTNRRLGTEVNFGQPDPFKVVMNEAGNQKSQDHDLEP